MNDYYDLLQLFYNEKHLYLTKKDKHLKCYDCPNNKLFTEKSAEIILSCGEHSDTAKCGNKIRILLPIHSSIKDLNYLKKKLQEMFNWETIKQYIDVDEKLINDNKSLQKKYEEEVSKLQELFNKVNVKDKPTQITDNYNVITSLRAKCDNILIQLRDPDEIDKKELMKQYIDNINKINELYKTSKELNDDFQEYYLIQDPEIIVPSTPLAENYLDFIEPKQKTKKTKITTQEEGTAYYGILYIMNIINNKGPVHLQDMYSNIPKLQKITKLFQGTDKSIESNIRARLRTGDNNMVAIGLVEKLSKKGYYKITKEGFKYLKNFKKDKKYKEVEEEPEEVVEEVPKEVVEEKSKEVVEEVPKEVVEEVTEPVKIKTGDSVKWTDDNGKELTGIVESKSPKKYKICCKPGKESGDKHSVYMVDRGKVSLN